MFVFTWWFSFLIWPRHDSQQAAKLCQCPTNAAQNEPIMNIFSLFLSVCPNTLNTVLLGIYRPWIMVFIIQLPNPQIYYQRKLVIYLLSIYLFDKFDLIHQHSTTYWKVVICVIDHNFPTTPSLGIFVHRSRQNSTLWVYVNHIRWMWWKAII